MASKSLQIRLDEDVYHKVEKISADMHVSKARFVQECIEKSKIIVIKDFDKLLPFLAILTEKVQTGDDTCSDYAKLKEGVDQLWESLDSLIKES